MVGKNARATIHRATIPPDEARHLPPRFGQRCGTSGAPRSRAFSTPRRALFDVRIVAFDAPFAGRATRPLVDPRGAVDRGRSARLNLSLLAEVKNRIREIFHSVRVSEKSGFIRGLACYTLLRSLFVVDIKRDSFEARIPKPLPPRFRARPRTAPPSLSRGYISTHAWAHDAVAFTSGTHRQLPWKSELKRLLYVAPQGGGRGVLPVPPRAEGGRRRSE